jgi:ElaB/YqjD/DUF883 family membrane-anchored ribosome-binding protein
MNDVSDTVQSAGSTLLDTIRENPIPAALAALGLGWLAVKVYNNAQSQNGYDYRGYGPYDQGYGSRGANGLNRYSTRYGGYGSYATNYGSNQSTMGRAANTVQNAASNVTDKVQDVAGNVADTVQDAASNVTDTAQQWASQAQDQAQEWADDAQWQMQRARGWLERTWESNPIALGVAALAAGAIIGGLIPETPMENRMMGEARDNLLQKAEDVAQTGVQKAQSATEQALHTVKQDVVQGQPQPSGTQSKPLSQPSSQAKSTSTGTQSGSMSSGSTSSKGASSTTPSTGSQKQTPPPTTETSSQAQTTTP